MEAGRLVVVLLLICIPLLIILITRSKEKKTIEQSNQSLVEPDKLQDYIIYVATEFENDNFSARAKEVSKDLNFSEAKNLVNYFHKSIPCPENLKGSISKIGILGVWMDICQNAIFEILANYEKEAVPLLTKIAFGEYDWTQYKSLEVLLYFTREGVTNDKVLDDLIVQMDKFRYEAVMNILVPLSQIQNNNKINLIFKKAYDLFRDDLADSLYILEIWSRLSSDNVLKHKDEIIDLISNESRFQHYSKETKEKLMVRGYILFYLLDKTDLELKYNLVTLSSTISNEKHKEDIFKVLKEENKKGPL